MTANPEAQISRKGYARLFNHPEARFYWRRTIGRGIAVARIGCRGFGIVPLKYQALAGFLGKYSYHSSDRHDYAMRHTAKASAARYIIVTHVQVAYRVRAEIEHDFAVLDIGRGYACVLIYLDCKIWG